MQALLPAAGAIAQLRYLLERGRVFNSADQPEIAKPLFERAWNEAREAHQDGYAVDAAHMLAIVETEASRQLEWNLTALALAERSTDSGAQRWMGSLYNNIGWTYHSMGDFAAALALFDKAVRWQSQHGTPQNQRIARWSRAKILRLLGRVNEALADQRTLLKEHQQDNTTDGYIFEELGECLLALGMPDDARPNFAQAFAELSQDRWLAAHEPERLDRLMRLGTDDQ